MIFKNKKFDIVTIGGATRDVFVKTDEGKILNDQKNGKLLAFSYGSKIIPEDVIFSYGGGALNAAVSFSRLGLKTGVCINIGKEGTGSLVSKMLEKEKISTSFITRDESAHTALSIIISSKGDHTMFLYRDANNNLKVDLKKIRKTKWVHVSSLTGKAENILNSLADFLEKDKIAFSWNPGSRQIEKGAHKFKELLKNTSILIMNKEEAKKFLKTTETNEKNLIKKLTSFGPKLAVITVGSKGSFAGSGEEVFFAPIVKAEVNETTGAGDAYGSTFIASQIAGFSVEESMKRASKNAASVVRKIGSTEGLLSKEKLR